MKRFALICLVSAALLAAIIISADKPACAADPHSGEPTKSGASANRQGQPATGNTEFLQIGFPVSKKDYNAPHYDYTSWVDHSASGASAAASNGAAPNYLNDGTVVPYTVERPPSIILMEEPYVEIRQVSSIRGNIATKDIPPTTSLWLATAMSLPPTLERWWLQYRTASQVTLGAMEAMATRS